MNRIIVPLDFASARDALALVEELGDESDFYKVGLELYTRAGPSVVRELMEGGKRVFLDLKLHDIPNTVGRAVAAASELGVDLLTVHLAGGPEMLDEAVNARGDELRLLGVTVLTSLSPDEMSKVWGREIRSIREEVGRFASMAEVAGVDGIVASPLEATWLRSQLAPDFLIVTPGIRPVGADHQDQRRVASPSEAILAGADYLVVGRPITRAEDPLAAFRSIAADIRSASDSDPVQ